MYALAGSKDMFDAMDEQYTPISFPRSQPLTAHMASCGPTLTMTGTTLTDARCSKVSAYLDQLNLSICTQYAGPDSILAGQSWLPWALCCSSSSVALPTVEGTQVVQALLSALINQAIYHVHDGTRIVI